MKLTISSTVMMRPRLYVSKNPMSASPPPQRVVGLLERSHVSLSQNKGPEKLVQYSSPDPLLALQQTAHWQDLLKLNNVKNLLSTAVFGFKFDGTNTWYQAWNRTTDQTCWLQHNASMNYQPYAILTMDALVSLLPNWDGTLHQIPDCPDTPHTKCYMPKTINTEHFSNLLVFDASIRADGQLWFLVTINSHDIEEEIKPNMKPTLSGWISPTHSKHKKISTNS